MVLAQVPVWIQEQTVDRKAPALEAIEDHADSLGFRDFVVVDLGVEEEVEAAKLAHDGAARMIDSPVVARVVAAAIEVVVEAAGVVPGLRGVVLGAAGVYSSQSSVTIRGAILTVEVTPRLTALFFEHFG